MFHVIHRTPMGVIKEVDVNASTIQEVVDKLNIPVNTFPTVCMRGEKPILRKHWNTIDLHSEEFHNTPGNELTFVTIPQGDVFKNILSLVATIALTLFAPYAAGFLAPLFGITSTLGLQLLQAGIVLAGSFLIGTFLSPTPNTPTYKGGGGASPTYSLTGQGNAARLFESIPKLYGKHLLYPDYASSPYSEYIGNQQYLNQLFCLGLGEYQIHEQRIEDTAYWNETGGMLPAFSGIEMEIIPPGSPVTLFHSQVVTSVEVGGQDLFNWSITNSDGFTFTSSNKRITSNNAINKEAKQFRLAAIGQKIRITTGTNAGNYTITSIAPNLTWIEVVEPISNANYITTVQVNPSENWIGPYVANPADTITNKIQVDFVFTNGLFYTSDTGQLNNESATIAVWARKINSAGLPVDDWFNLGVHTYTRRTATPQRFTRSYIVEDGRYEVRVRRVTAEDGRSRYRSAVVWQALKAFIPNDNIYPDVTLLAVRMLATGQLTQTSSKKINTIQTAKLPIYDPNTETWSAPTPTRSIAWAAADILRNTTYGASYDADYIDLDQLIELEEIWVDRGDTFNAVFDSTYSVWEALTMCLRTGRTIPVVVAGKVTFIREEQRSLPRGVFTPSNIQRGSLEIRHILWDNEAPDDIIVQFVDERTWKQNEVQCKQDGSSSVKPERMQIFGITDRSQAWREGMFIGAVNARRRVVATFTTEMEGRLLMRGDLVSVASDLMPDWGQTGVVRGYVTASRELWLSEYIEWNGNTDAYIMLRKRNGTGWGPVKIHPHVSDTSRAIIDLADLIIVQAAQGPIVNTFNLEDDSSITSYVICYEADERKDFIIVSGTPKNELVDITCIIEDPAVHTVDLGTPPPETYPYTGNQDPTRPIITFFSASEDPISNPSLPTVNFAWGPSSLADYYRLEISYDNMEWETIYTGPNLQFTFQVYSGALFARVQGVNTQAGPHKIFSGVFGIDTSAPLPVQIINYDYDISGGALNVEWEPAIRATSYRLNIYSESTPGSGIFDVLEITNTTISTSVQFDSSEIISAGGPWPAIRIGVVAINSVDEADETTVDVSSATFDPVTSLSLQSSYNRTTFVAQWSHPSASHFTVEIVVDGIVKLTYNSLSNTQNVPLLDMQAQGGPWRQLTVRVTALSGALTSTPTSLLVTAPTITAVTGAGGSYDGTNVNLSWNQTADNGVPKTRVRRNNVNNYATATVINTQTKAAGAAATYADPRTLGSGTWYYFITAWDDVLGMESSPVSLSVTV